MTCGTLRSATIVGLAALWICGNAVGAEARAWLDRSAMHMGETVTLNVEISGDAGADKPDFSVLQGDFDLLGTQSSSSVNIMNGQTSSKLLWAVGLQPKHAGTLAIPAIKAGSVTTQALNLTVLPAAAGAVGKAGDDVFVQAEVTPRSPYVQQEIRLTVKLYYALSLIDGNLEDPKVNGLNVHKLGQDSNYNADVDGRRYRVVERHYAASADNSGALELPPVVFRGRAMDSGDINSFFSRGRSVSAQSEPIGLDVRSRPPGTGNDLWLPAQSLALNAEGVDATQPAHAGEPLTLTVHLKAQGLGFEQLPELKLPPIDGADVYPDKETTQNRDDGNWVYGTRERKFAIVPKHAGALEIPAISIAWWDTAHDRAAVGEIPAQSINVLPAPSTSAIEPARPATATPTVDSAAPALVPISSTSETELRQWRVLALAGFALWLLTIGTGIFWLLRQRRASARAATLRKKAPPPGAGNYEFRSACARGDLNAAARALLRRTRRDRPALRNLGELAREVSDANQSALLGELERALYAGGVVAEGLARRLGDAFPDGPKFAAATRTRVEEVLPDLYPFRI